MGAGRDDYAHFKGLKDRNEKVKYQLPNVKTHISPS